MCGICGFFGESRSSAERNEIADRMSVKIAHRGPDDLGSFSDSNASLRHRRLAIIDIAGGSQPMLSDDRRYVLVFNGEIYNFIELRQELKAIGQTFRTKSDTEVLLQALIRWGKDSLPKLNGMFAFCFLDTKTGDWILARDAIGIKPLYWTQVGEEFVFASEIKALLEHPSLASRLDGQALQEYLAFQFCLGERTLFEGVRKLLPGTWMSGRNGKRLEIGTYWEPNYNIDETKTEEEFLDDLLGLLEDAANLQLRSDVPLGCYLSGGLDSSAVSLLVSKRLAKRMPLFHGRFVEPLGYDESRYAKVLADSIGGELHIAEPSAADFVNSMPEIIHCMDEPVAGPGVFPQYMVSKEASKQVKVVLGGQGGDEIFAGYARYLVAYLEQALKGAIFRTQEEGNHIVTLSSIVPNLTVLQQYHPLMSRFMSEELFGPMDRRYFRLIDRMDGNNDILSSEMKSSFDGETLFSNFQSLFNHVQTKSYINKMLHFDMRTMLPSLLQIEDRVSMAWGLESRVPLLDTRIADLVNRMPPKLKFKGGRTKHIFRKALDGLVPEAIFLREDKMGFPVPLHDWISCSPVRDFVGDTLLKRASLQRGIYKPQALRSLIDDKRPFGRALWGALSLELWHEQFID